MALTTPGQTSLPSSGVCPALCTPVRGQAGERGDADARPPDIITRKSFSGALRAPDHCKNILARPTHLRTVQYDTPEQAAGTTRVVAHTLMRRMKPAKTQNENKSREAKNINELNLKEQLNVVMCHLHRQLTTSIRSQPDGQQRDWHQL